MRRINFAVVLLLAILFTACKDETVGYTSVTVPVKVIVIQDDSLNQEFNYVGIIEESFATVQSFETGGNITHIYVKEGDAVHKGQLLATLNDASAASAFQAAKATLVRAQDGYNRAEKVYHNGSMSEIKWIEIQTSLAQAQSMYDIAKKSLNDCKLYATASGVASNKKVEQGMNVIPYQDIVKIMNIEQLKVKIDIPEKEIANVKLGQRVRIVVSALGNGCFDGTIAEKGIEADPISHGYTVKAAMPNPKKEMMPGMVCRVFLQSSDTNNRGIQIPADAIQISNAGNRYVWIVQQGKSVRRTVSVGEFSSDKVYITAGLDKGDSVIVEGCQKVSDETVVNCTK